MKTDSTKVYFHYSENNSKIEAVVKVLTTNEEIARREVRLRHGDKPDKILGRTYAFKKVMNYVREKKLLPGKEVENLWRSFGSTCKQPNVKLAY